MERHLFHLACVLAAGIGGGFEWFAALPGMLALTALISRKVGVIPVIVACAAIGFFILSNFEARIRIF